MPTTASDIDVRLAKCYIDNTYYKAESAFKMEDI